MARVAQYEDRKNGGLRMCERCRKIKNNKNITTGTILNTRGGTLKGFLFALQTATGEIQKS